jgi:hypothetical protein
VTLIASTVLKTKTKLVFKFILKSFLIHGGGLAEQITLSKA